MDFFSKESSFFVNQLGGPLIQIGGRNVLLKFFLHLLSCSNSRKKQCLVNTASISKQIVHMLKTTGSKIYNFLINQSACD